MFLGGAELCPSIACGGMWAPSRLRIMQKDFYLNERALAGYLEKDWFDHILTSNARKPSFEFAPFESSALYSNYHERLIDFLGTVLKKEDAVPQRMLEVGSSLGRTFFEVCRRIPSIETATLIEPSQNLFSTFEKIFTGGDVATASILKGNLSMDEVSINTRPIQAACSKVKTNTLNIPFQKIAEDLGHFDLVICSNVIDQCHDHLKLVEFLQRSTAPGGTLLLSCSYQWADKYIGNAPVIVKDINELFSANWKYMGETNLPFHVRIYERYWMTFLSHVVVYQRRE
jgi:SAM-dependent methyltransferase